MGASHGNVTIRMQDAGTARLLDQQFRHAELIEQSHQRSSALGLTRLEFFDFEPLVPGDLAVARERNRRLLTHAAPVMEMLFEQIVNTENTILLADGEGTILHSMGDDKFLGRAHKIALAPGVNWAEHSKGTNAIGTALFAESPAVVHGPEHFFRINDCLTGSAAPIFDSRGNLLGVLDVTGDQRSYHQHTMGLVRMYACMIENQVRSDELGHHLHLHFHSRMEFIGTLLEGVLVISGEGKVLGANRSAADLLDISNAALRMSSLTSLFGTTVEALYDHFRSPLALPLALSLSNARQFHFRARLNRMHPSPFVTRRVTDLVSESQVRAPSGAKSRSVSGSMASVRRSLLAPAAGRLGLHYLNTGDPAMGSLVDKVRRMLDRDIPLLILGETGTGKELLARAVHHDSNRSREPFVAVNCASIPESLIEAELFGYEDGAFTGARRKGSCGRILQANGGTLFLDEIGDMPLLLQARLLRALQERCITPLGSLKLIPVNIAVISATHRNLREMIQASLFREDLYYRLNGLAVRLPALRERTDLAALAQRILSAECPVDTPGISAPVMELLTGYTWPGNVRQLANVLRTAVVMATGEREIARHHLPDDLLTDIEDALATAPSLVGLPATRFVVPPAVTELAQAKVVSARTLGEVGVDMIRQTLAAANGNISVTSRQLGISRNTIYRKLGSFKPTLTRIEYKSRSSRESGAFED
jgi:transcriptional regulator of acetoin/glycerol metabolism